MTRTRKRRMQRLYVRSGSHNEKMQYLKWKQPPQNHNFRGVSNKLYEYISQHSGDKCCALHTGRMS